MHAHSLYFHITTLASNAHFIIFSQFENDDNLYIYNAVTPKIKLTPVKFKVIDFWYYLNKKVYTF